MSRTYNAVYLILLAVLCLPMVGQAEDTPAKLILMAGKPSHPPRMHEFNAGVQVLADCLNRDPRLDVQFVLNGWPKDERIFEGMAAVVFYMDGGTASRNRPAGSSPPAIG